MLKYFYKKHLHGDIMIEYIIGRNSSQIRADRFLLKATTAPSSLIYKAFRKKDVKINGKWIKEDYVLCEGDVLRIYIKEDFRKEKEVKECVLTAPIIFEDENIIIFNKPAFLPCQPDEKHKDGTLSDMLKSYLIKKGEYNPESESSFSPALCNRLDTNTSGLIIGAKNAEALRDMNEQIRNRKVYKYYLCRLENIPQEKSAFVNAHIIKEETQNKSYIGESGKEISMEYKVIEESGGTALCEVLLHTGRSHQIRAYFSSIGCPLVGDTKYGAKAGGGQALCSYRIRFGFPDEYDGVLSYLRDSQIKLEGIDI